MRQSAAAGSPAERANRRVRILSVVAATAIALSCGTNYAFSAWEPQFAEHLELSATQANLIGNFGNLGMYAMGIPGGILVDRKGPRWGVLVGVIGLPVGYFALRGAFLGGVESMSVSMMCFFSLLTGVASCTAFSGALKVCATNWPQHRGTATAFPLSAFGLSAFFWTTLSAFLFPDDTSAYLLLLAIGTTGMVFVGMLFLQMSPPGSAYEMLPTDDRPGLARSRSNRSHEARSSSRAGSRTSQYRTLDLNDSPETIKHADQSETVDPEETELLASTPTTEIQERKLGTDSASQHNGPNITGWILFKTPAFWKLWIMLGLLCGVGLMTINNIGNNARVLWHHYDPTATHEFIQGRQTLHVGILSLGSFAGRLGSGIGSDWLIHHESSRFWTLVTSACIFTIAQCLGLTIENPNYLFLLSSLTGLAYGALFGVYPALVVDAFGPTGMGINWGAMTLAPVVWANFFNLAYGSILDRHSILVGHERICGLGLACYGSAYWITLAAALVGGGWALWCVRQDRVSYARDAKGAAVADEDDHQA